MAAFNTMIEWLQAYWNEVVYLSLQHLQIVAVSSALAIVIALPIGVWMSRPNNRRRAMAVMQVLNIGQAVPKLALLTLAMTLVGVGAPAAIFALWVATPLAFLVGGGGLGELIFTGIDLNDYGMMLAGAIATAGLAMLVDMLCGLLQRASVSRGLQLAAR